ncbi:uncharacterized protein LOC144747081 [Ciona intestinalis]
MASVPARIPDVLKCLKDKYIYAEKLMLKPAGLAPLRELIPAIDSDFDRLMNLCQTSTELEVFEGTEICKSTVQEEKDEFDAHVRSWIETTDSYLNRPTPSESHRPPSLASTTSSVRSQQRRSRVNLAQAKLAKEQAQERLHETRQRARLRAERQALEAERQAREAKEQAERQAREEEEEAELAFNEKQRELELARVTMEAWTEEDGEATESSSSTPVPRNIRTFVVSNQIPMSQPPPTAVISRHVSPAHPPVPDNLPSPQLANLRETNPPPEVRHSPLNMETVYSSLPTRIGTTDRYPRPLPHEDTRQPDRVPVPVYTAFPETEPIPTHHAPERRDRVTDVGERFLPRPVIDKFDGNPMNYWTFVRQFETHINRKTEGNDLKLVYLLQHCDPHVRAKISHLTSKPPDVGYRSAWGLLYEEYGQPHEIARYCEEHLKNAPRANEHDPVGLKNLSVLMDRCCTSLQDLKQSSSIDSMEIMLNVIAKLPPTLREEWVKRSFEVERLRKSRAKFADLSAFVCEKSAEANSIFGRAMHPVFNRTNPQRRAKSSVYNSVVEEPARLNNKPNVCICCAGSHCLSQCERFRSMSLQNRKEFVQTKRLCFKCFMRYHSARECRSRERCKVEGCTGNYHHTLLHNLPPRPKPPETSATNAAVQSAEYNVFLNVVPVKVRFEDKVVDTYAFLDQGSTTTFCDRSLVNKLQASGETRHLTLKTLTSPQVLNTVSINLSVRPLDGGDWIELPDVIAIDKIPVDPNPVPSPKTIKHHQLNANNFPKIKHGSVQLLIGANAPQAFRVETTRSGHGRCPDAVKTPLGWSLLGPSSDTPATDYVSSSFIFASIHGARLQEAHAMFLSDESDLRPITADSDSDDDLLHTPVSAEDRRSYRMMKQSVQFETGHYELPLPWRHDYQVLPDNTMMAIRRLAGLKKRLVRNPDMKSKYDEQMQTMLTKGYAEEVPMHELKTDRRVWYLPHHPVMNPHKPDKLRVVFDCAAQHHGISINQVLMQGPDLVNSLVGVLTRFRREPVALVADIEGMFHQVRVAQRDRDSLRFWWWPGGDTSLEPAAYRMKVHLFGATSSPSCASFCLRQAATDFGGEFDPDVATVIKDNFLRRRLPCLRPESEGRCEDGSRSTSPVVQGWISTNEVAI